MINLLPEEEKLIIKKEYQSRIKVLLLLNSSLCLIAVFLIILIFNFYYQGEKNRMEVIFQATSKEVENIKNSNLMKEKNRIEAELSLFEENDSKRLLIYSSLLKPLAKIIPNSIYLKQLQVFRPSFSKPTSQKNKIQRRPMVKITGYAPDRETLLEFKKNLERADWLTNFYFPPANWISEKDIIFYLTFELK